MKTSAISLVRFGKPSSSIPLRLCLNTASSSGFFASTTHSQPIIFATARNYGTGTTSILDFCKDELAELEVAKKELDNNVSTFLSKNAFKIEKEKDSSKLIKKLGNATVTIYHPEKEEDDKDDKDDKHDHDDEDESEEHNHENQDSEEKEEEHDFTITIKKGEDTLTIDGWTKGTETYDIDRVAINDAERYMEVGDNEQVQHFKGYIQEELGLVEPDFPTAVADIVELANVAYDTKWTDGISKFLKRNK